MRQCNITAFNLRFVEFTTHLADGLDHHQQAVHAGVAVRQPAAGGVDGQFAAGSDRAIGTGLGLPTVHGIVHQAGGEITMESVVDAGTAFTVFLPAADTGPSV